MQSTRAITKFGLIFERVISGGLCGTKRTLTSFVYKIARCKSPIIHLDVRSISDQCLGALDKIYNTNSRCDANP